MIGQNILRGNGQKIDLKLDLSEFFDFTIDKNEWVDLVLDNSNQFDFTIDTTGWVDIVLDCSELYDFQLDYSVDYELPIIYESTIKPNVGCDYTILTQDGFSILTQNEECIQYQH